PGRLRSVVDLHQGAVPQGNHIAAAGDDPAEWRTRGRGFIDVKRPRIIAAAVLQHLVLVAKALRAEMHGPNLQVFKVDVRHALPVCPLKMHVRAQSLFWHCERSVTTLPDPMGPGARGFYFTNCAGLAPFGILLPRPSTLITVLADLSRSLSSKFAARNRRHASGSSWLQNRIEKKRESVRSTCPSTPFRMNT